MQVQQGLLPLARRQPGRAARCTAGDTEDDAKAGGALFPFARAVERIGRPALAVAFFVIIFF